MNNAQNNVKLSYGRCLIKTDFFDRFYQVFMNKEQFIKDKFSETDFVQQKKMIRHGVNLMILFAVDNYSAKLGLARLRESHSHSQLDIPPRYYHTWKECLLDTIKEADPEYTAKLRKEWSETLQKGIDYIAAGYDEVVTNPLLVSKLKDKDK